jgi:cobalt/nickel transport protein
MDAKDIIIWIIIAAIFIAPFIMYSGLGEDQGYFGGSDDSGSQYIEQNNPNYKTWANVVWEPPSGEIESLLFALQAAIGGIIFGYVFGMYRTQKKYKNKS